MGEAAPYQGYLPASITAKWVGGGTVAMFLEQPEADTIFGPICGQACRFGFVEYADPLFNFAYDGSFGFVEEAVKGVVSVEWDAWFQ